MIPNSYDNFKIMMFIDGENLAMRYGKMLGEKQPDSSRVTFERDVFVWSRILNLSGGREYRHCEVIRKHYYTSVKGDTEKRHSIHKQLESLGIEVPKVFPRDKSRGSKRVDITLAVDMLSHAYRKNYDTAVLVAGDEDYVPLVEEVMREGRRVFLWFFDEANGLQGALKRTVDYYFDIGTILFQ